VRVVVLGAGFGGLELTTRLSEEFGADVDIVLIDRTSDFVFGFSKLEVMFGRALADHVRHPYRDFVKPGVQFVQTAIRASRSAPTCIRRRRPVSSKAATSSTPRPARSRCATCWRTSRAAGSWSR
jgi:hypothetical protein